MKLHIPRDELKVGMYIVRAVLEKSDDARTHVDYINNTLVDSPQKLNELKRKNIKFLIIDTAKSQKPAPAGKEPASAKIQEEASEPRVEITRDSQPAVSENGGSPVDFAEEEAGVTASEDTDAVVPFEEESKRANEIRVVAVNTVKNMLRDAAVGKSFETDDAKEQVNDMVDSVFRNKDALLSLTRLKSFDEYTFTHSVNVAVISIVMAKEMGYDKDRLRIVGLGCMLHDIGKMKIPDAILNKPDRLTEEERKIIQNHPLYSEEILKERDDIPEVAKRIAYEHHERSNGQGYPYGKKKGQFQEESAIAMIADVYDALTSTRVYKAGLPPPHALQFIKSHAEKEFLTDLVDKFIEVLGIFPVGSVVEFNTGQIGIVREINRKNLFQPYVVLVMNANRQKIGMGRIVGPAQYKRNDIRIIRYHDPLDLNIFVSEFIDKDLLRL